MAKIISDPAECRKEIEEIYGKDVRIFTTSGGFDPIHIGHIRCIKETAEMLEDHTKDIFVVIVNGDGFLQRKKGKPFMKHIERMEVISAIAGVDYVVGWDDGSQTVSGCIEILKPEIFTKGGDRSEKSKVPESYICDKIGCEILYGIGGIEKVQSSSDLISNNKAIDKIE
jgi:cytidyltransferase-like protein